MSLLTYRGGIGRALPLESCRVTVALDGIRSLARSVLVVFLRQKVVGGELHLLVPHSEAR